MARPPDVGAITSPLRALFLKAFSGSGFLPPANARAEFLVKLEEDRETPSDIKGRWKKEFVSTVDSAYNLLSRGERIVDWLGSRDTWKDTLLRAHFIQGLCTAIGCDGNKSGSLGATRHVLELYSTISTAQPLWANCVLQIHDADVWFGRDLEELTKKIRILHKLWDELAKYVCKEDGSCYWRPREADWAIALLDKWAKGIDQFEHSLEPLTAAIDYYHEIYKHTLDDVPTRLFSAGSKSSPLLDACANLYCGLRNAPDDDRTRTDLAALDKYGEELRVWLARLPLPKSQTFIAQKVRSGQVYYNRHLGQTTPTDSFGNPDTVSIESEKDVILGVSRLDFEKTKPMAIELAFKNHQDRSLARFKWDQLGSEPYMWDSNLSWIQIPKQLRDRVRFSSFRLSAGPVSLTMYETASGEQVRNFVAEALRDSTIPYRYNCDVEFAKAYASDNVRVHAWLMDFSVHGQAQEIGVKVLSATRYGFKLFVTADGRGDLRRVRIGYCAYEGNTAGFWARDWIAHRPTERVEYLKFDENQFKYKPAVAVMLSWYRGYDNSRINQRVELRCAASRDGIVVRSNAWWDSVLYILQAQIIAISND